MPLQKIVLRPGVNREGTDYSNEGGYFDGDKVRFRSGFPESIGGWVPYSTYSFMGSCSLLFTYSCTCGAINTNVGTHLKYYIENGSYYYDITPLRDTEDIAANAFTTNTGTPTIIVVNHTNHGAVTGAYVTISTVAAPVNGVPADEINGEHRITVIDANSFSFAITTAPTSSGTTGACTVEYQINPGLAYTVDGTGWGVGDYGRSTWGSGVDETAILQLRLWSADNYGNAVVFGPRDGKIYYWDYNGGVGLSTRATDISTEVGANHVPLFQTGVLVTEQRFVVVFGSNDYADTAKVPMLVRWSDQENYLEWEPMSTTQAGSYILTNGSHIITGKKSRQEVLIWTDTALYSMQYLGPPYVYGFTPLSTNTTIIGPNAVAVVDGVAYWMGVDKFYVYDGQVRPLPCTVRTYIFNRLDQSRAWQVVAGLNLAFNEVWWHYTSDGEIANDSYVIYNYVEDVWTYGSLSRDFWYDTSLKSHPIAATYDQDTEVGALYEHENGCDNGETNPPTPITAYVTSSDFDIGDGHNFGFVHRLLPDITFEGSTAAAPQVTMTLTPRRFSGSNYGSADSPTTTRNATVPVEQYTEQLFVRVRGRQMNFTVQSNSLGTKWQLGVPRIDMRPDGRK